MVVETQRLYNSTDCCFPNANFYINVGEVLIQKVLSYTRITHNVCDDVVKDSIAHFGQTFLLG
jgi:hypothetical protein